MFPGHFLGTTPLQRKLHVPPIEATRFFRPTRPFHAGSAFLRSPKHRSAAWEQVRRTTAPSWNSCGAKEFVHVQIVTWQFEERIW